MDTFYTGEHQGTDDIPASQPDTLLIASQDGPNLAVKD